MKKKIMLILATVLACTGMCNAKAVNLKYTEVLTGPDVYSGRTVQSETVKLTTDSYSSVTVTMVDFYTVVKGNLRSSVCKSDNSRTATIIMYEDDVYPNEDDKVKTYSYGFTGLKLTTFNGVTKHMSTNIDSSGDKTAELYHTTFVSPISGDTSGSNGPLITYQYSIYN